MAANPRPLEVVKGKELWIEVNTGTSGSPSWQHVACASSGSLGTATGTLKYSCDAGTFTDYDDEDPVSTLQLNGVTFFYSDANESTNLGFYDWMGYQLAKTKLQIRLTGIYDKDVRVTGTFISTNTDLQKVENGVSTYSVSASSESKVTLSKVPVTP